MPSTAMPSIHDIVAATGAWKPPLYLPVYAQFFEPVRSLALTLLSSAFTKGAR
jgi:hypothetical protein